MAGDGCPVYTKVIVKRDRLELREKIMFAWDEATFDAVSLPLLDEVAQALKDQGYKKIIVEGHTDSRGGDEANLTLSQRRADSVRTYLVSRGIDSAKITSVGIGEARPVADNESAEGRANNRRVELVVTPE